MNWISVEDSLPKMFCYKYEGELCVCSEKVFRHNKFGIVSFSKKEGIFDYGVIYVIDKHGNSHLCYKEDLIDDVSIDEQNEYWEYIS